MFLEINFLLSEEIGVSYARDNVQMVDVDVEGLYDLSANVGI